MLDYESKQNNYKRKEYGRKEKNTEALGNNEILVPDLPTIVPTIEYVKLFL